MTMNLHLIYRFDIVDLEKGQYGELLREQLQLLFLELSRCECLDCFLVTAVTAVTCLKF